MIYQRNTGITSFPLISLPRHSTCFHCISPAGNTKMDFEQKNEKRSDGGGLAKLNACDGSNSGRSIEDLGSQGASTRPSTPQTPTGISNPPSLAPTTPTQRGLPQVSQGMIDADERFFNLTSPPALPTKLQLSGVARPGITEVKADGEKVFLFTPPCDRCVLLKMTCATGPASTNFPCRYCSRDGAECKRIGGPVVITYPTGPECTVRTLSTKKRPRFSDPGLPPTTKLEAPYRLKYTGGPSKVPRLSLPDNSNSTSSQMHPDPPNVGDSSDQLTQSCSTRQSQHRQSGPMADSEASTTVRKALNTSPLSNPSSRASQPLPWVPPGVMISIPEILTFLPEHIIRPSIAARLFASGATSVEIASFMQWSRGGVSVRASKEQVDKVRAKMNRALSPRHALRWEKLDAIDAASKRNAFGGLARAVDVTTSGWCLRRHKQVAQGGKMVSVILEAPTPDEAQGSPFVISLAEGVPENRRPTAKNEKLWLSMIIESATREPDSVVDKIELCELKQLMEVFIKNMSGTVPVFDLSGEHPDIAWAREWKTRMAQLELEENVRESVEV